MADPEGTQPEYHIHAQTRLLTRIRQVVEMLVHQQYYVQISNCSLEAHRIHLHVNLKEGVQDVDSFRRDVLLAEWHNFLNGVIGSNHRGSRPRHSSKPKTARSLTQLVVYSEQSQAIMVMVRFQPPVI